MKTWFILTPSWIYCSFWGGHSRRRLRLASFWKIYTKLVAIFLVYVRPKHPERRELDARHTIFTCQQPAAAPFSGDALTLNGLLHGPLICQQDWKSISGHPYFIIWRLNTKSVENGVTASNRLTLNLITYADIPNKQVNQLMRHTSENNKRRKTTLIWVLFLQT